MKVKKIILKCNRAFQIQKNRKKKKQRSIRSSIREGKETNVSSEGTKKKNIGYMYINVQTYKYVVFFHPIYAPLLAILFE